MNGYEIVYYTPTYTPTYNRMAYVIVYLDTL